MSKKALPGREVRRTAATALAYHTTDVNDAEWQLLEPMLLLPPKPGGRPIKYPRREIVNAIRYILRTGGAWRMLPRDLLPTASCFITIAPGGR